MPPLDFSSLPFLTRKMLAFEEGAVFGLRIIIRASSQFPVQIKGITKEGPFKLSAQGDATAFASLITNFGLPDVPIWITVTDDMENHAVGACFVSLYLTINGEIVQTLANGFVDAMNSLSWPVVNTQRSQPYGEMVVVTSADPAAGAELAFTVPDYTFWRVRAVRFALVTDGTAANRVVHLVVKSDSTTPIYEFISGTAQTASLTRNYSAVATPAGTLADDNDIIVPIPNDLVLRQGHRFATETTALQAGDNFGVMKVLVERFINNS